MGLEGVGDRSVGKRKGRLRRMGGLADLSLFLLARTVKSVCTVAAQPAREQPHLVDLSFRSKAPRVDSLLVPSLI